MPDPPLRPDEDVGRQPGDGALAVRAGDRDDRDLAVGVADPRRRRRPRVGDRGVPAGDRPRGRLRSGGLAAPGATSRSVSATAASAIDWARSAPVHGNVTIQWPGSDERWTATPPRPSPWSTRSRRIQSTIRSTSPGHSRRGTAAPSLTTACRPGLALAVPGPPPADGDLDLDHRRQPVDVRTLEQADLDQAHGPARIASAPGTVDCPSWRPRPRPGRASPTAELAALDRHDPRGAAGVPRRPRAARQHRLRQLHEGRRRRDRPVRRRLPVASSVRTSRPGRTRRAARRDDRRHASRARRAARGSC